MSTSRQIPPFTLLTFNLLAPCYKRLYTPTGSERRDRERHHEPLWTTRLDSLLDLLLSISPRPDVIALQEVWFHPAYLYRLEAALSPYYSFHYAKRPGSKEDGLATLVLNSSMTIVSARKVAAFPLADADRVGLAVSAELFGGAQLLVVNAHLTFPHCFVSRRTRANQAGTLVSYVSDYLSKHGDANVHAIVLGDFNGDSDSAACKRMFDSGFVNCYSEVNGSDARPTTHYNHMHQQVFVDHVFLKSNFTAVESAPALPLNSLPIPRRKRSVFSIRENPSWKDAALDGTRRSRVPNPHPRSVSPSPVAVRDLSKACCRSFQTRFSYFRPVKTVVYPERFVTDVWPAEFDISDHRPVAVQFSTVGGP